MVEQGEDTMRSETAFSNGELQKQKWEIKKK
jgi:hypothetical protein